MPLQTIAWRVEELARWSHTGRIRALGRPRGLVQQVHPRAIAFYLHCVMDKHRPIADGLRNEQCG